jgi:type IV secretion system protein TrbL
VESYIVVGGGVLLLGFAGSRWTTEITSRYLSYAVAIGIKLFTLYLIVGIGNSLAGQWGVLLASPDATLNPRIYFQILGGALSYMMLAWYIPSLASSLYSGTVALSLAEFAYTARGVGTWAASVGTTAVAGSAAAMEGSRAVVEAARLGRDTAATSGGGVYGVVTGALDAGSVLAREGVRATVPTLVRSGDRVSGRIAEERALRRPTLSGYGRSEGPASSLETKTATSGPVKMTQQESQRPTT